MKIQSLFLPLLLLLTLALAACDLIASAPPTYIKTAVMARDAQGANLDPVGVSDTYAPDAATFHAVVTIANAPKETTIKAVWTAVDVGAAAPANSKIDESEIKADGSRNLDFQVKRAALKWNAGLYKVELFVNGKLDRTLNFVVSGTAQAVGIQAAGTCPPATTQPHKDSGWIAQVIMAEKIGNGNEPQNRTAEFLANETINAFVSTQAAPAQTKFRAAFFAVDADGSKICNVKLGESEQIAEGAQNLVFSLKPGDPWKLGNYRVDIYVNNTLDHTTNYTVVTQKQVH